jgi:hypothetical protein
MGTRLHLKASVDIARFSPANQVILHALKTYGMILADHGSNLFISGAPDSRWNDADLANLRKVVGSNLEDLVVHPGRGSVTRFDSGHDLLAVPGVRNADELDLGDGRIRARATPPHRGGCWRSGGTARPHG